MLTSILFITNKFNDLKKLPVYILVDVNNVEQMAAAMKRLYNNRAKFKSIDIREYCINNFSEDAVVNKLDKVYNSVLELKKIYNCSMI